MRERGREGRREKVKVGDVVGKRRKEEWSEDCY